jgi:hypothetical protein
MDSSPWRLLSWISNWEAKIGWDANEKRVTGNFPVYSVMNSQHSLSAIFTQNQRADSWSLECIFFRPGSLESFKSHKNLWNRQKRSKFPISVVIEELASLVDFETYESFPISGSIWTCRNHTKMLRRRSEYWDVESGEVTVSEGKRHHHNLIGKRMNLRKSRLEVDIMNDNSEFKVKRSVDSWKPISKMRYRKPTEIYLNCDFSFHSAAIWDWDRQTWISGYDSH